MKKILFVCLGNICRSPSAEAVMNHLIAQEGLQGKVICDSAGTGAWHVGEPADARMQEHADKRDYELTSRARKFNPKVDFETFDFIIGMDQENVSDLKELDPQGKYAHKIYLMTDFSQNRNEEEVPDPYYGGAKGFELVLDILEDACAGLMHRIKNELDR